MLCVLVVGGCYHDAAPPPKPPAPTPVAAAPEPAPAPEAAAPEIAISELPPHAPPECEQYRRAIIALMKCDKLPRETQETVAQAWNQAAKAWTGTADMSALAQGCKSGAEALEQSMASVCGPQP
jgi:7-keto-8-aminopelargonate synthetase-like enzyme